MANDFVTVARYSDPIFAQMAVDVLAQEGIVATAPGVGHSGVLGAAGSVMLEVVVQVRQSDAVQASELLEALEEGGEVVDEEAPEELRMQSTGGSGEPTGLAGDGPYRERRLDVEPSGDLKPIIGASVGLVLTFGAGHFYAREKASAALLALAEVVAFLAGCGGTDKAFLVLPAVIMVDVFGSGAAVRRANEGKIRTTREQLLRTGAWIAVGAALFHILGRVGPFVSG